MASHLQARPTVSSDRVSEASHHSPALDLAVVTSRAAEQLTHEVLLGGWRAAAEANKSKPLSPRLLSPAFQQVSRRITANIDDVCGTPGVMDHQESGPMPMDLETPVPFETDVKGETTGAVAASASAATVGADAAAATSSGSSGAVVKGMGFNFVALAHTPVSRPSASGLGGAPAGRYDGSSPESVTTSPQASRETTNAKSQQADSSLRGTASMSNKARPSGIPTLATPCSSHAMSGSVLVDSPALPVNSQQQQHRPAESGSSDERAPSPAALQQPGMTTPVSGAYDPCADPATGLSSGAKGAAAQTTPVAWQANWQASLRTSTPSLSASRSGTASILSKSSNIPRIPQPPPSGNKPTSAISQLRNSTGRIGPAARTTLQKTPVDATPGALEESPESSHERLPSQAAAGTAPLAEAVACDSPESVVASCGMAHDSDGELTSPGSCTYASPQPLAARFAAAATGAAAAAPAAVRHVTPGTAGSKMAAGSPEEAAGTPHTTDSYFVNPVYKSG